jgi:hypothetical protein
MVPTSQSDSGEMDWKQAYDELVAELLKYFQVLNSQVIKTGHAQLPSGPVTMIHEAAP